MSLHSRIESAIHTAKQWESDASLLAEIRGSIPFEDLVPEQHTVKLRCDAFLGVQNVERTDEDAKTKLRESLTRDDDVNYEGDDLLLKRLTLFFKNEVMKWVNSPPCTNLDCTGNEDGKQMKSNGVRGPISDEEKRGQASRVETYICQLCNTSTTFPRFNSPRALFTSRRGRCGEFANLFGTYCRAVGFDTRYCLDLTDHVWVECWSVRQERWLHADSCEGLIDRPNMYEQGWGKKLNYVIGATHDSVTDITKRYTCKFYLDDFQLRRREFSPDESTSDRAFQQMNATVKQMCNVPKGRLVELEKRAKSEDKFFRLVQSSGIWENDYKEGRISGSYVWKSFRGELGDHGKAGDSNSKSKVEVKNEEASFLVESFYATPHRQSRLSICVKHPSKSSFDCISVNDVPCAATLLNGTSMVVIDELSGCILQCQAFSSWLSVGAFIDAIPDGRILALASNADRAIDEASSKYFQRVGGLSDIQKASSDPIMFIGQVGYNPQWATCINTNDALKTVNVSIQLNISSSLQLKLRSEPNVTPRTVSTRLPESIMPLKAQMEATEYQKRVAFQSFITAQSDSSVVGYTTRPQAPIYLIGNDSFPMRQANPLNLDRENNKSWTTYHYLPDALVSDDDIITNNNEKIVDGEVTALFDIPISNEYFIGLLGNEILSRSGASPPVLTNTAIAIENTRLVALYFSAHWCGPCRTFTPMLIEFYNYLKEVAPTHGLEIIFVSSDRTETEFQEYYSCMPFKAIPFANRTLAQQLKSVFGVRGIPSMVVIDTLSGQIVVSQEDSRHDVHQACRMGEQAVERQFKSWLDKIPIESKAMLDILALSCYDIKNNTVQALHNDTTKQNAKAAGYLIRKNTSGKSEDAAATVKKIFTELVTNGTPPNEAAVKAIEHSTNQSISLAEGDLKGRSDSNYLVDTTAMSVKKAVDGMLQLNSNEKGNVVNAINIAKKYVTNVQKDPTNPRFRSFKLSNKVFDQITSATGSLDLLTHIGFSVFPSDIDFMASIPLSADLKTMTEVLDKVLEACAV